MKSNVDDIIFGWILMLLYGIPTISFAMSYLLGFRTYAKGDWAIYLLGGTATLFGLLIREGKFRRNS